MNKKTVKIKKECKAVEMVTTAEAGKLTGLSTSTILRAIKDGKLRAGRTPGGHYRIHLSDLVMVDVRS